MTILTQLVTPIYLLDERLLRPAMLEALLNHLPASKAEFSEVIPHYLRVATNPEEAKYLDQVLGIIADYC